MAWSCWWPAPIQESTKSHLIQTKDTFITQEIPRDLGIMKVLGILCQEWGTETNTYIFCDLTKWTVSNIRSYYGNITSSNAPISSVQENVTILILQMRKSRLRESWEPFKATLAVSRNWELTLNPAGAHLNPWERHKFRHSWVISKPR